VQEDQINEIVPDLRNDAAWIGAPGTGASAHRVEQRKNGLQFLADDSGNSGGRLDISVMAAD